MKENAKILGHKKTKELKSLEDQMIEEKLKLKHMATNAKYVQN